LLKAKLLYYHKHKQFKSLEEKHKMLSKLIKPKSRDSKGFTLIEIVIVLAIAGLIFVIVFLAVQQAQRSRRDTQRRGDAARYLAAAEQYAGNNNGDYPSDVAGLNTVRDSYVRAGGAQFVDPTTGGVYIMLYSAGTTPPVQRIEGSRNARCAGPVSAAGGGLRSFAVVIHQESGGSFCVDNT
jgi:prepilin-type N-terminal cleavage/methylation domain-containing protein